MPTKVLNEDWSEYDNRKIRGGSDARNFACTEIWEVNYLVSKIRCAHPGFLETTIRNAIAHCCSTVGTPHPRQQFVQCVMNRLNGFS